MKQYLDLMSRILDEGVRQENRTGIDTISVFGHQMRFDLRDEKFPLITTKKMFMKGIVGELVWMLSGTTNIKWLQQNDIHIWDEWADVNDNLGPVYGAQWRRFSGFRRKTMTIREVDQITQVIDQIKTDPHSRRHIVSAWNPAEIEDMALPPCHVLFQFYVNQETQELSCQLYQRSADVFLGVPFNIASYALLTRIIAQVTGYRAGELIWTGGDCHLYINHLTQVTTQLARDPLPPPILKINPDVMNIDSFIISDFELYNYKCHPPIRAEVAV